VGNQKKRTEQLGGCTVDRHDIREKGGELFIKTKEGREGLKRINQQNRDVARTERLVKWAATRREPMRHNHKKAKGTLWGFFCKEGGSGPWGMGYVAAVRDKERRGRQNPDKRKRTPQERKKKKGRTSRKRTGTMETALGEGGGGG